MSEKDDEERSPYLHWIFLGCVTIFGFILGGIGYNIYYNGEKSIPELVYLSLQLMVLNGQTREAAIPVPWELHVARFLLPLIGSYALIAIILTVFHEEITLFKIRSLKGHVIICGLGEETVELLKNFRKNEERVVIIDDDCENRRKRQCEKKGALIVIGDAKKRSILKKANVGTAKILIALCEDDAKNMDIAMRARQIRDRAEVKLDFDLRCFVHLKDAKLCKLFEENQKAALMDQVDVKFFNIYRNSARLILKEYPPHIYGNTTDPNSPPISVIIIGFGVLGESLVLQAARTGQYANGKMLSIHVFDRESERKANAFRGQFPQIDMVCDIEFHELDALVPWIQDSTDKMNEKFDIGRFRRSPIDIVYICLEKDTECISHALTVMEKLKNNLTPIVACFSHKTQFSSMLAKEDYGTLRINQIFLFNVLDRTCTREFIIDEQLDSQACQFHEFYRIKHFIDWRKRFYDRFIEHEPAEFQEGSYEQLKKSRDALLKVVDNTIKWIDKAGGATTKFRIETADKTEKSIGATVEDMIQALDPLLRTPEWELDKDLLGSFKADYLKSMEKQAKKLKTESLLQIIRSCNELLSLSLRPWEVLWEEFKTSNRMAADNIDLKLWTIGCIRIQDGHSIKKDFKFDDGEIDLLARLEHDRWNAERLIAGWKWGAEKDEQLKINPYLISWEKLDDEIKGYDLSSVKNIPELITKRMAHPEGIFCLDVLAQEIHEGYQAHQKKVGMEPGSSAAMKDWDSLDQTFKKANLDQARHIFVKLKAVGMTIGLARSENIDDIPKFTFRKKELEKLAMMEHVRWCNERLTDGWKYDRTVDTKNIEKKVHPSLVPWRTLPLEEKEKDRQTVRGIPLFLAHHGLEIYRTEGLTAENLKEDE